jgi:hypothetical protein
MSAHTAVPILLFLVYFSISLSQSIDWILDTSKKQLNMDKNMKAMVNTNLFMF